jgi:tetratricopeptide (TPR) repeat protein
MDNQQDVQLLAKRRNRSADRRFAAGEVGAASPARSCAQRFTLARSAAMLLLLPTLSLSAWGQEQLAERAADLFKAGQYHDAELVWRQLESRDPRNASIHANLGVALSQQGDLPAAVAEYRRSLVLSPQQADVSYNLGVAEFKQGHFAQALPALKTVARQRPGDERSALLIGMTYFGLRQYAEAVTYLQPASKRDPANVELHNVLAQSCLWSNKYDCALEEFKSILTVDPDAVQAHMLLAEALDGMGKTEDAIQELEAAARIAPKEPILHFELGYLYYKKGLYEQAVPELQLEATNNPGYAQTYAYLGDISLKTNDAEAAEPLLVRAIQLGDKLRLAYFDLGCVYADQKKIPEALAAFEHAAKLDPAQPDAHYRLARLYSQTGQKDKAAREFALTKELHAKTEDTLIQKVSGEGALAHQ